MVASSRPPVTTTVLWAIAWAAVIIASAILFKGNPIKDWVQSGIFVAAMIFWAWQSQRASSK
ncbi:MAG TPA: hypothetical protein VGJ55_08400 [Pyrinomonadaceae bacterium]|jgi:hypothetical protein